MSGIQPPKPVSSFGHLGFDEKMMNSIIKAGYTTPTPIQAQVCVCEVLKVIVHIFQIQKRVHPLIPNVITAYYRVDIDTECHRY